MACEPTAQPESGPTIWIEASAGPAPGTAPDGRAEGAGVGDGAGVALAVALIRLTGGGGVFRLSDRSCQAPRAMTRPATNTPPAIANDGTNANRPCGRRVPCRTPAINDAARSWRGLASRR